MRAILTYADRLSARGHDVELVVPARTRLRARWRQWRQSGTSFMPGLRARIQWVDRWHPADLRDADVIVATAWQSADAVAEAPPNCGIKTYLIQHFESLYHGVPDVVDATYRLPLHKIVISTWLRDIIRERFASDAAVIVTPVDPALFHRVPVTSTTPRPRVLMLQHDYAWKGVAEGMEVVRRARARVPSMHLVGFGVRLARPGLAYAEFHENPPQDRLAALYSGVDIYLCPSWDEGLGMPSMEAMACGAALVTFDNGGSRDYARDGETAFVASRRDVDQLVARLVLAAEDAALRERVAAAGSAFVRSAFSWETAVSRMEELFVRWRKESGATRPTPV